ncbi:hypothetical protein ACFL7M_08110 [Thermodesulfobacteriota bacterium]
MLSAPSPRVENGDALNNETKLYDSGLDEYPWSVVISENFALTAWISLGTAISWELNAVIGLVYLIFSVLMILVIMRKLVCTRCYYYGKRCHVGWGKISVLLYKQGDIDKFNSCAGIKIAPVLFASLALIPLIFGVILLIKAPSITYGILMTALILFIVYSSVISRKRSCSICKMKLICPGGSIAR